MAGKMLYLNSRDELYRIEVSRIVYFESDGNYTNIVLSNNVKGVVCMNLSQMKEILNANLKESSALFARVGKRHIINLDYVYNINVLKQKLVLSDGSNFTFTLSVSKDALKSLKELFLSAGR